MHSKTDAISARSARGGYGKTRTLGANIDGNKACCAIGHELRDEEGIQPPGSISKEHFHALIERRHASNGSRNHDTHTGRIFFPDFKTRLSQRFLGRHLGELLVPIDAASYFYIKVIPRVKFLHLTRNLDKKISLLNMRDRAYTGDTVLEILPSIFNLMTQWIYRPHPCYNHSSCHQIVPSLKVQI